MSQTADLLFRHVQLFDGSGADPVLGDLAVTHGRISAMGPNLSVQARQVIDGTGLVQGLYTNGQQLAVGQLAVAKFRSNDGLPSNVPYATRDWTMLPEGEVVVSGRIAPPPAKLYEFDGAATGPIRQNLDLSAFRAETRLDLLDGDTRSTSDV